MTCKPFVVILICSLAGCGASQPNTDSTVDASMSQPETDSAVDGSMSQPRPDSAVAAAPAPPSCDLNEQLAALSSLVGTWQGSGWIEMTPGKRDEFDQRELVRCAAAGDVLVIDGEGVADGATTQTAAGMISYNDATRSFELYSYRGGVGGTLATLELPAVGRYAWSLDRGPVEIRFEITVSGDTWHETGRSSYDGGPWQTFFEMTLQRTENRSGPALCAKDPADSFLALALYTSGTRSA